MCDFFGVGVSRVFEAGVIDLLGVCPPNHPASSLWNASSVIAARSCLSLAETRDRFGHIEFIHKIVDLK